ncbi:MAG: AAA family ATPase [Candidatus Marsarchaeota archaeon]|nr:AAA family ATPase [Candidatus Marsarchaeota archaeon]MCL5413532.1 AAA family ATPase [Candidatus Marsarchaeota archaeon]
MSQQESETKPKSDTPNPKAKELYKQAGVLFEENKFEDAIATYGQAISEDPNYSSAYFNRALAYAIINKYSEATRDAEKVLDIEPDSYDAPYVMGIIAEYQNDFQGAKEWYDKALSRNPKYEQARGRLEALKAKMNKHPEIPISKGAKKSEDETVVEEGQIKKVKFFKSSITFSDVVGMDKQKKVIHDNIVLAITKPDLLRAYGKKLGLGVIFYGPPGNGKTYLVNAIAGETKSNVIIAQINQIVDMYAGNTEKNMHAIFQQAREAAPCIVFFDELDALGVKRGGDGGGGGEGQSFMRMAVNQFLQEMDGVEKNPEGLFVIGATNAPWDIDPALKRSKRFGETVYMPPPDYKTRKGAFKYHTRKMPISHVNFDRLARSTMGFSSADIEEICDKAALIPAVEEDRTGKRRKITMNDFLKMIKTHGNTLDEWYGMVKKDIISKTETQIVDGKKQVIVKEGKLGPEEKQKYKALVKDVKRNSNAFYIFIKKLVRSFSLYVI